MQFLLISVSGFLSAASLLLPWYAPYWAPGIIFAGFVSVPLVRRLQLSWFRGLVAILGSWIGWFGAVVCYFGSLSPPEIPLPVWMTAAGFVGGSVSVAFILGIVSKAAWNRILLAGITGGLVMCVVGEFWYAFPAAGWRWLVQMGFSMALWQVAVRQVLWPAEKRQSEEPNLVS